MANKVYTVMKDGEVLKELKTLAAAKKLADAEDAGVFDGGLCVYAPDPVTAGEDGCTEIEQKPANDTEQEQTAAEDVTPAKYCLTHLMNVRSAPSMEAKKVKTLRAGTEVAVLTIRDDWMHLADGTFILFGGGKWAVKQRQ